MESKAAEAKLDDDEDEDRKEECYENTSFIGERVITSSFLYYILVKDRMKPVPIDEFEAHVQRMHADRDRWFELEYNVSLYMYS